MRWSELVPRRLAEQVLVDPMEVRIDGSKQRALARHEPLLRRERRGPVDVRLGVPLALS